MATAARTAQSQNEQIVSKVLASLNNRCGDAPALNVLAWERQAIHLALRRDYDRRDISYRGTLNGDTFYRVRGDSQPAGHYYVVTVHPIAHPSCTCLAGVNGRPCKHAGLALGVWAEQHERARAARWNHLSRAEHRELCALGARYYDSRERAGR